MAGISIWQLAIIAIIVVLLFGSKRLRTLGGDLGTTIKGFKQAIAEDKTQDGDFNVKNNADAVKPEQQIKQPQQSS